ncbi:capsular associated protein [Coprinopsis cinerea okayama7|uniref:Capsular associated protein n=1 Tax=Coprinopsis cinerea (strain Okayama-7 / 130 / ATCC MYA-4618 / FGSC 9003) TaxID=240176 RepID=A8P2R8_COPC7|nr:capsular associated protein [Coprinopsis cinerea okayama7\|eukprot:XP_001838390.1 capsular associated protein [Coprinopsis cinerea okayama7\
MAVMLRRRSLSRLAFLFAFVFIIRLVFFPPSPTTTKTKSENDYQIKEHNFIERATRPDKSLNVQKHPFLQARIGRDETEDLFTELINNGMEDYWLNFQLPYILNKDTSSTDTQHVLTAIDQLLSLNGWVGHLCPTLVRPFGQNKRENLYDALIREDHLYYVAIVIHSADHFLVDQLAVIVQMARRLGTHNLFVSMLDYDSSDSTETLVDLSEAVLTLLGVPFRIRRVPSMTEDPAAAYYPLEEAYMRNLALEPLHELRAKRKIEFARVVWLKGFTCPNDILETIKISFDNEAAMVCGMDWAEHNGFFIFSDRWRTRDIEGDQFRQSKSSSKPDGVPPRDKQGAARYAQHLPFQVFCCESGTHVVDPAQSYYRGIAYRSGTDFHNVSMADGANANAGAVIRDPDAPCLDSSQAWFCRDLWVYSALHGMNEVDEKNNLAGMRKREVLEVAAFDPLMEKRDAAVAAARAVRRAEDEETEEQPVVEGPANADPARRDNVKIQLGGGEEEEVNDAAVDNRKKNVQKQDQDANAGSDYDAIPAEDGGEDVPPPEVGRLSIPNSVYRPARILVNPRCPTTYAGVSHTKLARDLFGEGEEGGRSENTKYILEDWEGAPESFVCQEQRQTGGRKATKSQRRLGFSIHDELEALRREGKIQQRK